LKIARILFAVGLVATLMLGGLTSPAEAAQGPDSHNQPLLDGCQRSNAMQLGLSTPEWVYVDRSGVLALRAMGNTSAGTGTVQGVVADIHPAGDDLYVNHDYNDIDIDVAVDPAYQKYVASGNGAGQIGTEWEDTLIPTWAWPQVGDRVQESGSWIWDCGHWGNGPADPSEGVSQLLPYDPAETLQDQLNPGTITGEQTELHPLYEVATFRKDAAGVLGNGHVGRNLQRLDVWINGDGGPALSEEECALYGLPPLVHSDSVACSRYRDVGGHYSYTMQLGPGHGRIVVNPTVMHPETTTEPQNLSVQPDPQAGTVTVTFDLPHSPVPQKLGLTVEAGWESAPLAVHHVVSLDTLTVNATLDGPTEPNIDPVTGVDSKDLVNGPVREQTPNPGEWLMWAAANGHWQQISPSLIGQVQLPVDAATGKSMPLLIPLHQTFDYWLPKDVAPTLFVSGRECDIPLIDCRSDHYGAQATDFSDPFTEVGYNDKPGRIELGNSGLPLQPGQMTFAPQVNPDPFSTDERYSDWSCRGPCYSITATSH
jgi:hypothetical protein